MDEINDLEENYFKDVQTIRESCYKMAWYMRGAVSLSEAMMMSYEDRNIINDIIKENLETAKKTGMPFF